MPNISRIFSIWMQLLLVLILALGIGGCNVVTILSGNDPLPTVSPLALPKLPDWIEEISPTGEAEPLAQIRIRFKEALIPVESLDNPQQQRLLQKFEILPPLPGQFRFLTPRMVGFQADKALPKATRVKITLKAGLADLKNHRLAQDIAWTFNTAPIKLTNLPGTNPDNSDKPPLDLKPTLKVTSNVELSLGSLQQHVSFIPEGKKQGVPLKVDLEKAQIPTPNEQPQEKFDSSIQTWNYTLTPQQTLEKATNYRLKFSPGLRPERGNLLTEIPITTQVATYSPLQYQGIQFYGQPDAGGAYGRFVKGSPQLKFNNGIIADSAMQAITINPPPRKDAPRLVQANDGDNIINLNPWTLEPATNYTITIGEKLKDKFGQSLDKPVTIQYATGDVSGDIWTSDGLNIFPSGKDLQLNITTVNLPESKYKAAYKVVQPTDLVYVDSAYPSGNGNDLLPNPKTWQSFKVSGKKNQSTDVTVPLREKLGASTGMLAYGTQARTNSYQQNNQREWREPTLYGLVQLTNLGVFSQWFPELGMIRVHHLADGSPAASASVEIYESKLEAKSRPQPVACASGKTDSTGTLLLDREKLKQCFTSEQGGTNEFVKAPKLLVIAREGQDWAFTRTDEYSGAYGYGFDGGWDDGKPASRGVIISDRQLYQPGEKAWFTGFAYYLKKGAIAQDKNASYQVTLVSPNNQKTNLGTQTTNEFGTFSLELPLKANQPLGYYSIRAKSKTGAEISGEFRVAEFKPPNFKVDLSLDRKFALIGETVAANAQSNYLFGAPVQGGKAQYYVTRQKTEFIPKGWEQFSFGQQWFWPEESPVVPTDVLQSNAVLDEQGKGKQTVTVTKDLPYPMTYRVDAQVADVSNLSVSNSQTFIALPSDRLIGLQSKFVADAGKPFPIQLIVTDPTGKAIADRRVHLELQQMNYSSVTRLVEGSRTPQNQVDYKTVGRTEVTSSTNPQSVSLIPPESGSYRIRANFTNSRNEVTATDLQIWATGTNPVVWGSRDENNRLEVKLDKQSYQPGETATALIQSPYPEGELYFAVVRDKPLYQQITKVKGGAPQIQFQVTPDMLPNAAVEAVLVRQGVPLSQVEPGSLENLVRIGFAPFKVNLADKYLKVQLTPGQAQLEPGAEQTLQLQLKDVRGNPTKGQFTVMVVNESVLQLSGYRPPDLVNTVYADQPISTRFSDNRPNVVLQPQSSPLAKGWGYGGGFSAGAANTRVRKDFQALAYYNGSVLTDASGKAQINYKLPDDLTTWRVMAVATDGNLHFGNGEATFITTKALLSNPVLPQFARPGDRFFAGLSLTNHTGQTGTLAIQTNVSGSLQLADNKQGRLQTPAESGTRAYRFPLVASRTGEGNVQIVSQLNQTSDAFAVPLAVKPFEITEQVVESGTTNSRVKILLNVDKTIVPDAGGLQVSLASTLIPEITAPARQVLQDEQLPFLEATASQLAIASTLQTLSQQYGQTFTNFNPTQQAKSALSQLQKLQMPDGGFATWRGKGQERSDAFVTPYAAESLARASQAFPNLVDAAMLSRLGTYLKTILADPGKSSACTTLSCKAQVRLKALMALAQLGEKRNDFLADIYAQRNEFDAVAQIELARYLSQFPEWQNESQTLIKQLQETIYQTGRTATVNLPQGWGWLSSPTTTQAQALRLFVAQKSKPELLDRLLQSLLNLRRNGTWQTSYDNAQALMALVDYSRTTPTPPNFAASVQLAGKTLGSTRFVGYQNPSLEVQQSSQTLPKGRHDLMLNKSGRGTLHYLVAYRYRLPGNQPGRFNGLRVTRDIRPVNGEKPLRKIGLYAIDEPLTVPAGQVFDIGLEVISDRPVEQVVITDPLSAGFEAVDESFQTATAALQPQNTDFDFKTIYRDRIVAFSDRLQPGVYQLHYLVRSVTPGTFLWPGAEAHLQYAPEEFGRSADSTLVVSDNDD